MIEALINCIDTLQKQNEFKEKTINDLKEEVNKTNNDIDDLKQKLILELEEQNKTEFYFDDLNACIFSKENVGYKDEAEVIKWLNQNCQSNFVKIKTTESIDKTALKKELKNNIDLANDLSQFLEKTITKYVVVTTKENHQKMLEHIKEGK